MTSPINGFVSNAHNATDKTPTSIYSKKTDKSEGVSKNLGDQDTFLKLLVAQMKYQDPSKPADSTQFLAQTAQFTQVEKLGEIADMLSAQQLIGASSLVGRTITYLGADGAEVKGVVTAAKLGGSEPTLKVGDTDVQLSTVTEVHPSA
jgi:flagellar basal-body rod modification protein FlgD